MAENSTSLRPTRGDVYLVLGLAAASMIFAVLYSAGNVWMLDAPMWVCCIASILITAPLLYRRRFPSQVAWIQSVIYSVAMFNNAVELSVSQIVLFMGIYSIGAWQHNRRTAFWSRLFLCIGMGGLFTTSLVFQFAKLGDMTVLQFVANGGVSLLTNVAFFGGAWLFGNRAWKQRRLMDELRSANAEVRCQEQQLTRQSLDLERVRIARELHDGIAHHITGVGIHAAAARRSLEKNPDKARESLKTIESSTRETVDELRALVYTLRDTDDASTAEHGSKGNPSLGDIPELVDGSRRSGQRIEVLTIGQPRALTPITEMSIYRVIQESLTNCSRYAGPHAEVQVRLRYGASNLEVEISDSRSPGALPEEALLAPEPPAEREHPGDLEPASGDEDSAGARDAKQTGLGLGIVGMRERMSALGGSLEAGPKSRGGWLVRAQLPYPRNVADPTGADPDAAAPELDASTTASSTAEPTAKA